MAELTDLEPWGDSGLLIHAARLCDPPCPFHAPSKHHMVTWPLSWRPYSPVERHCPHGIGHPDPDSLTALIRRTGSDASGIHGCDGCCVEPGDEQQDARERRTANARTMVVDGAGLKKIRPR